MLKGVFRGRSQRYPERGHACSLREVKGEASGNEGVLRSGAFRVKLRSDPGHEGTSGEVTRVFGGGHGVFWEKAEDVLRDQGDAEVVTWCFQ